MATTISKPDYFPALDGLRGIAILLILTHHNFKFTNLFLFGWLGVDLFFVLSGFLITSILLRTLGSPNFLRNFYTRRFLRIFPVFYLTLICFILVFPHIPFLNVHTDYYIENQIWLWTYLQNWLFIFRETYGDPVLLHTWSLAIEEQFYFVWPILILFVRKPRIIFSIALAGFILIVLVRYVLWSYQIEGFPYSTFFTYTRIDGLCIGCCLAVLLRAQTGHLRQFIYALVIFIVAINSVFYFISSNSAHELPYLAFAGYSTATIVFALLVYAAVSGRPKPVMIILNSRILKFFGKISYGLYVYHWPIKILLFEYIKKWIVSNNFSNNLTAGFLSAASITIIAILISVVSYRYFEMPFLRLKEKFA